MRKSPRHVAGVLVPMLIIAAALAAYSNSFRVPFLYDDAGSIEENNSLRAPWLSGAALFPPNGGSAVSGRPAVNLSFALNYAGGKLRVRGYHAVNLALHVLAALTLFGLVRRTLLLTWGPGAGRIDPANGIAGATALLWCLHPLQTESVTYLSQRAESLMGLCYLFTLYAFVRGVTAKSPVGWWIISAGVCGVGMASKEVMVSAPLMVWFYDRTFVAGNWADAWSRRRGYYLGLASTWLVLIALVWTTHGRGGTAGFGTGMRWQDYLVSQFPTVMSYLRLALWPRAFVFGHGSALQSVGWSLLPGLGLLLGAVVAIIWAFRRSPPWAYVGVWFFVILAPSSSFVPIATETYAEHRMYLALISLILLGLGLLWRWLGVASLAAVGLLAVAFGGITHARNSDYRTSRALWTTAVAHDPENAAVHFNLGVALALADERSASMAQYRQAVNLKPDYPEAWLNLGNGLLHEKRYDDAMAYFAAALRTRPSYAEAFNAMGTTLAAMGRASEGMESWRKAIALRPDFAEARHNLGLGLAAMGLETQAVDQFEAASRTDPRAAEPLTDLGLVLAYFGHQDRAIIAFEKALALNSNSSLAQSGLANALMAQGRTGEAVLAFQEAIRANPTNREAHANLGVALARLHRLEEAVGQFKAALALNPDDGTVRQDLELALRSLHSEQSASRKMDAQR